MGPVEAITTCLRKSFRFSGRASRSEFWWFASSAVAVSALTLGLWGTLGYERISDFRLRFISHAALAAWPVVPLFTAATRRLRDAHAATVLVAAPPLAFALHGLAFVLSGGPSDVDPSYPFPDALRAVFGMIVLLIGPALILISTGALLVALCLPSAQIAEQPTG